MSGEKNIGLGKVAIVANDNPNLLDAVAANLEDRFSFRVLKCTTLDQVSAALRENPDVVLAVLDNSMPRFEGDELPPDVEANHGAVYAGNLRIPVILMTGGGIPDNKDHIICLSASTAMGARSNRINPFNAAVRIHMAAKEGSLSDTEDTRILREYKDQIEDDKRKCWSLITEAKDTRCPRGMVPYIENDAHYLEHLKRGVRDTSGPQKQ